MPFIHINLNILYIEAEILCICFRKVFVPQLIATQFIKNIAF